MREELVGPVTSRVVVIVPTYNERDNIEVLAARLAEATADSVDLLVVDDASPDGTADVVRRMSAVSRRVHLMEREGKRGLGPAKIAGIRWALARGYEAIVEMDGDLSHDPAVVPLMVRALDHADLVIGSRYVPGGGIPRWSMFRRTLSRAGNMYQRAMLGIGINDATSGFRAYRSSILTRIDLDRIDLDGFGFLIEMVRRVARAGGHVTEVPIFFAERRAGESKIDLRIVLEAFVNVTKWGLLERRMLALRGGMGASSVSSRAARLAEHGARAFRTETGARSRVWLLDEPKGRVVISAVIPVWGDEHNLGELIPSLRSTLGEIAQGSEIVVAAGPGREPLRRLAQTHRVPFVEAAGNGYGEILGAALSHSRGDYLLTMDADYSHKPDYARAMWEHRHSGEFLVGSRYLSGSYLEVGLARRLMSRAVNAFYRRALSLPFSDITSGFRMFPRRLLEDIGYPEAKGLDVLPEMLTKAVCRGWRVAEVPIWYQGTGPLSRARAARLGLGYARTLTGLLGLRNSVRAADYDSRAFDSVIPLQRYWQRRRFGIAHDFASGAGSLLDVGCGTSRIIQSIPGAVGVDVAIAKLRWLRGPGRRLAQADVSRLPFKDECFDAVICSEVIEHVPREEIRLEEMIRVIHPGGTLILGTPDYGTRTWRALEWLYNRLFPLGYTGEHVNPYTFQGLSQELRALGLEILDCRYVGGGEMIFKARVPPSKHGSPHRPGDDRVESLAGR